MLLVGVEIFFAFAGLDALVVDSVTTVLNNHFSIGLWLFLLNAFCPFLLIFFFFDFGFDFLPMGVGHSTTLEGPLQYQEEHDRANANQSSYLIVDFLRTIGLC